MEEFERYLNIALRYLSFRPRSEKEVIEKLKEKKATQEIIGRVMLQLKDHKFVEDAEFAKWFVDQRLRFKPKSLGIIKLELKQKGISPEIIQQAIENLNEDSDSPKSDLESAKKLVEKRISRYKGISRQEIYQKLGGYLARRGFNWDTIKKSIDDSLNDEV